MDLETLRANTFFLQHHGKGFTERGIDTMSYDTFAWNVAKLQEQLKLEADARKELEASMRAKNRRSS